MEWVVAVPSHTTFGKRASGTYQIRVWVGHRGGRMLWRRKNLLLRLGIVSLVTIPTTLFQHWTVLSCNNEVREFAGTLVKYINLKNLSSKLCDLVWRTFLSVRVDILLVAINLFHVFYFYGLPSSADNSNDGKYVSFWVFSRFCCSHSPRAHSLMLFQVCYLYSWRELVTLLYRDVTVNSFQHLITMSTFVATECQLETVKAWKIHWRRLL